jgi:NADH pyrophosphatase NudC (nudix superfamily)
MTDKEAMAKELEELVGRFSEGWHEGIKIDASDIMLLCLAAKALAQPQEEPLHPVHIGVDVTREGTAVTAFYRKPDAVMEMFYSQFHPMAQRTEQEQQIETLKRCLFQMQEAAKDLVEQAKSLTPPQRTEQNFCSRCEKRTPDLITIHTCTPPKENT